MPGSGRNVKVKLGRSPISFSQPVQGSTKALQVARARHPPEGGHVDQKPYVIPSDLISAM